MAGPNTEDARENECAHGWKDVGVTDVRRWCRAVERGREDSWDRDYGFALDFGGFGCRGREDGGLAEKGGCDLAFIDVGAWARDIACRRAKSKTWVGSGGKRVGGWRGH